MSFNIETVAWSEPRIVETAHGPKQVRTWPIPAGCEEFWSLWRTGNLKQRGYSVSKWRGNWQVTQWRAASGAETAAQQRATAAAAIIDREEHQAENIDPELPPILTARYEQIEPKLLEYQRPSVKRLALALASNGGGLDASDTGTGKTFVALAVAATLGMRAFVICPKPVIPTWRRAARMMGVELEDVINYEMLRTGNTEFGWWQARGRGKDAFVFSPDLDPEEVLMVFDECHRMKDYTTKNCAVGLGALDQGFKTIALSATAADNPMHMKFVSLLTGLIRHPAHFFGWMTQNGVRKGRYGMEFAGGRDVLRRIHRQVFPTHGTRIRIADLGDRFPQTQIIAEAYQMNGAATEIQAIYDEMHEEIAKLEASERRDRGASILTAILRARQRVELLKVPTLVQMAEDGLAEGMSVIVAVNYEDTVQALADRLNTRNTITGKDKPEDRQTLIDRFNDDQARLIIMNIKAGGLGISLHGTADSRTRLVLINPTYSGIDLKQALGRAWRAGGARSIQKVVFAADTIEERACEKVRAKMARIDMFNEGDLDNALSF